MPNIADTFLATSIPPGRALRRRDDRIWCGLREDDVGARYDGRAALYDRVVGNAIYNRIVWGARVADYRRFAAEAVESDRGPLLDAGCGSCVFTADAYRAAARPIVLVDRSIGMLQAARDRLSAGGDLPPHVALLQADLFDLPFRAGTFSTVLSMGMLHLFDDVAGLAERLAPLLAAGGRCFATSLVDDRAIGRAVLRRLHRAGEVVAPRSADAVGQALSSAFARVRSARGGSMAYFRGTAASGVAPRAVGVLSS